MHRRRSGQDCGRLKAVAPSGRYRGDRETEAILSWRSSAPLRLPDRVALSLLMLSSPCPAAVAGFRLARSYPEMRYRRPRRMAAAYLLRSQAALRVVASQTYSISTERDGRPGESEGGCGARL